MAKVFHRKARKDYPEKGISKGDMYYTTRIKTGPRSSRVIRQLTPIKPSQMTSSAYKAAVYSLQENFAPSDSGCISEAADSLREISEEEWEKFNNMPDGLQQGDTGQMLEERANSCDEIAGELDEIAGELEELENNGEPEQDDYAPDDMEDYHFDVAEYNDKLRSLPDDAICALGEVVV